jgi:predicted chitinase
MIIRAKRKTLLKKEPTDSKSLGKDQIASVEAGKTFPVKASAKAEGGHTKVVLDHDAGTWYVFNQHWDFLEEDTAEDDVPTVIFTEKSLKAIMPHASAKDISTYVEPLNKVCARFDITTAARAAAFIAQLAHESGSLRYKEEIASGEAYEGRKDLGNIEPGDGKRYKGRGLIQLTGRANYRQAGKALGLPLEDNPELVVSDPYTNALVAGWFWDSRGLNPYADRGDFLSITKRINGGTNGLSDREAFYGRAKAILTNTNVLPRASRDIIWTDPSAKVSQYFTVREVTQGDMRRIPKTKEVQDRIFALARELDKVREAWGGPILVTSWFRPEPINRQVGGVPNSRHTFGDAVDIRPGNASRLREFQSWLDTEWYGALGYGASRGFVHLDMRNGKGFRASGNKSVRWNY